MWIILIVSQVGFWSAIGALVARLCGWQVLPVTLVTGIVAMIILAFVYFMCQAADFRFPEDQDINRGTYFGRSHKIMRPAKEFIRFHRR